MTETLDDQGHVASTSITETTTTLAQVGENSVTLNVMVCVEVSGKRFDPDPQTVQQGFHGEIVGQNLQYKEAGAAQVIVEGRKIPCKLLELKHAGASSKTATKVYYTPDVPPYVLKRESVTTDAEGKTSLSETSVGVVARDMPSKVLAELKTTSILKAVQKHPKGTVITWARTSTDIPGGIVSHSSKELNTSGRVIRRSTLELLDYGKEPRQRVGIFGHRHPANHFFGPPQQSPRR